jgi:hypothetical protein
MYSVLISMPRPDTGAGFTKFRRNTMPTLNAPEGAESVSVGDAQYKVEGGRIEAALEHVEALLAHGYTEFIAEAKKIFSSRKQDAGKE